MLGLPYAVGTSRFAEAILQHYGAPTHYIDLTHDLEVAAWFAVHQAKRDTQTYIGSCFRRFTYICYERVQAEHGYVLVLALPNRESLVDSDLLFPLKDLPEHFVRPNRQKGWLMLDQPPIIPNPNDFWICSIPIVAKTFSTDLTSEYLFPGVDEDPAFRTLATYRMKDVGWKSRDFKVVTRRFRISKKFIAFAKQNWRNHTTISFARSLSLAKFTKERRPQARLPTTTTSDFGSL
jgi:hypothetical protein